MPLITASEINAIAFSTPIDPALIIDEIISASETKFIIPAITKPIYEDLSIHPGIYATLISDYIKPYQAYCIKLLLYSQYYSETLYTSSLDMPKEDIVNETNLIIRAKNDLLVTKLSSGNYPLYIKPPKKLTAGFLVKRP